MNAVPCCDLQILTGSAEETFELGRSLGQNIDRPIIIGLHGDLGAGKTLFIQGLARGLEVPLHFAVTSPTYTIINQYPGRLDLFHVDLYRLEDPGEFEETGLYDILDGQKTAAIEWAERLPADAQQPDLVIMIETKNLEARRISLFFYGPRARNLLETLKNFKTDAKVKN